MKKFLLLGVFLFTSSAEAHSWYSRTGCCGGQDCAPIPLDTNWISVSDKGYQITLTLEQAKQINPFSVTGVNAFVPFKDERLKVPPALLPGEHYHPSVYDLCISPNGYVRCLFIAPEA